MGVLKPPTIIIPDQIDFAKYLTDTDERHKVKVADDYVGETLHALMPAHERPDTPKLPFANAWVYFPPGGVTLWAGFNDSGKSLVQGQVLPVLAQKGFMTCIGSLEMGVGDTMARMVRQHSQRAALDKDDVQEFLTAMQRRLWFYDHRGTVRPDKMIAVVRYCAQEVGIQHMALDSLMKCVKGVEDYDGQKDFVNLLTAVAQDLHIHVHLVVHMRKSPNEKGDERIPTRYDIKGASEISDLVDTVLIVWRNKEKERERDAGKPVDSSDPDTLIVCDKQRHCGGWEGRVKLWFEPDSQRFIDKPLGAKR